MQRFDAYIRDLEINSNVEYIFSANTLSKTAIVHRKDGKTEVIIAVPIRYREPFIQDVLNHEIGTHLIRKYNERAQVWAGKRKQYKIGSYLHIEEGLGSIHQSFEQTYRHNSKPFLYQAALNYVSAYLASKMGFRELYHVLKKWVQNDEKLWNQCLRVKRGELTRGK